MAGQGGNGTLSAGRMAAQEKVCSNPPPAPTPVAPVPANPHAYPYACPSLCAGPGRDVEPGGSGYDWRSVVFW